MPHGALDVEAELGFLRLKRAPQTPTRAAVVRQAGVVHQVAQVHLGHVGVQEKGPDAGVGGGGGGGGAVRGRNGVFVPRVLLHHRPAFEVPLFVVVPDRADARANPVVWLAQHEGAGDEGFLVAFARRALAEHGVEVRGTEDVVVGCEQERREVFFLGYQQLPGFAGARRHVSRERWESGDGVEDRVFGRDPVIRPGDQARGGEGFGREEFGWVAQRHAVAVEVENRFKRRE